MIWVGSKGGGALSETELRSLRVGDRVWWDGQVKGEVMEASEFGFRFQWADGQEGWIHVLDGARIRRYPIQKGGSA